MVPVLCVPIFSSGSAYVDTLQRDFGPGKIYGFWDSHYTASEFKTRMISPQIAASRCPSDTGFYPHSSSCHLYYHCSFGIPVEYSCPPKTLWSTKIQNCDWAEYVQCPNKQIDVDEEEEEDAVSCSKYVSGKTPIWKAAWGKNMQAQLTIKLERSIERFDIQLQTDAPVEELMFFNALVTGRSENFTVTDQGYRSGIARTVGVSRISGLLRGGEDLVLDFQMNWRYGPVPNFTKIVFNNYQLCGEKSTTQKPTTKKSTTQQNILEETKIQQLKSKKTKAQQSVSEKTKTTAKQSTTEKTTTQQPTTQKITTEKSTTQKPNTEKSTSQKPTTENSTTQQPTTHKITTQKSTTVKSKTQKPTTSQATTTITTTQRSTSKQKTSKPTTQKSATSKPTTEKPTITQPNTVQPTTTQTTIIETSTKQPTTTQPTTSQPITTQPTTKQPTTIQPTTKQHTTTQPTTKQPTTTQPSTKQPTTIQTSTKTTTTKQPTTTGLASAQSSSSEVTVKNPVNILTILEEIYDLSAEENVINAESVTEKATEPLTKKIVSNEKPSAKESASEENKADLSEGLGTTSLPEYS